MEYGGIVVVDGVDIVVVLEEEENVVDKEVLLDFVLF